MVLADLRRDGLGERPCKGLTGRWSPLSEDDAALAAAAAAAARPLAAGGGGAVGKREGRDSEWASEYYVPACSGVSWPLAFSSLNRAGEGGCRFHGHSESLSSGPNRDRVTPDAAPNSSNATQNSPGKVGSHAATIGPLETPLGRADPPPRLDQSFTPDGCNRPLLGITVSLLVNHIHRGAHSRRS